MDNEGHLQLDDRLRHAFRCGTVGGCVNGVTHDINNFLGAILAYAELIEQDDSVSEEARRMLVNIQDSVKNSTDLLGSLTAIARREKPDSSVIELPHLLESVLGLKRYEFRVARIALELDLRQEMPSLLVDRPRLMLALVLLLANAQEAVQGRPDARVDVVATRTPEGVELAVVDSGPGVPEGETEAVFAPFYTTKEPPHLGLGLTLAREYARAFGGDVVCRPGAGFVIRLSTP